MMLSAAAQDIVPAPYFAASNTSNRSAKYSVSRTF